MFELYEIPRTLNPPQLWHAAMVPEDRAHAEQVLRESLRAVPFKLEFRIRVKDGIRHIRSLANRVLNKQGEVERLLGDQYGYDRGEATERGAVRKRAPAYHPRLHRRSGAVHRYRHEHHLYEPGRREDERLVAKRSAGSAVLKVLHITFGENGPLMENIHSGDMSRTDIEQDVVLNCRNGGSFDIHYSITPLSTTEGTLSARCW